MGTIFYRKTIKNYLFFRIALVCLVLYSLRSDVVQCEQTRNRQNVAEGTGRGRGSSTSPAPVWKRRMTHRRRSTSTETSFQSSSSSPTPEPIPILPDDFINLASNSAGVSLSSEMYPPSSSFFPATGATQKIFADPFMLSGDDNILGPTPSQQPSTAHHRRKVFRRTRRRRLKKLRGPSSTQEPASVGQTTEEEVTNEDFGGSAMASSTSAAVSMSTEDLNKFKYLTTVRSSTGKPTVLGSSTTMKLEVVPIDSLMQSVTEEVSTEGGSSFLLTTGPTASPTGANNIKPGFYTRHQKGGSGGGGGKKRAKSKENIWKTTDPNFSVELFDNTDDATDERDNNSNLGKRESPSTGSTGNGGKYNMFNRAKPTALAQMEGDMSTDESIMNSYVNNTTLPISTELQNSLQFTLQVLHPLLNSDSVLTQRDRKIPENKTVAITHSLAETVADTPITPDLRFLPAHLRKSHPLLSQESFLDGFGISGSGYKVGPRVNVHGMHSVRNRPATSFIPTSTTTSTERNRGRFSTVNMPSSTTSTSTTSKSTTTYTSTTSKSTTSPTSTTSKSTTTPTSTTSKSTTAPTSTTSKSTTAFTSTTSRSTSTIPSTSTTPIRTTLYSTTATSPSPPPRQSSTIGKVYPTSSPPPNVHLESLGNLRITEIVYPTNAAVLHQPGLGHPQSVLNNYSAQPPRSPATSSTTTTTGTTSRSTPSTTSTSTWRSSLPSSGRPTPIFDNVDSRSPQLILMGSDSSLSPSMTELGSNIESPPAFDDLLLEELVKGFEPPKPVTTTTTTTPRPTTTTTRTTTTTTTTTPRPTTTTTRATTTTTAPPPPKLSQQDDETQQLLQLLNLLQLQQSTTEGVKSTSPASTSTSSSTTLNPVKLDDDFLKNLAVLENLLSPTAKTMIKEAVDMGTTEKIKNPAPGNGGQQGLSNSDLHQIYMLLDAMSTTTPKPTTTTTTTTTTTPKPQVMHPALQNMLTMLTNPQLQGLGQQGSAQKPLFAIPEPPKPVPTTSSLDLLSQIFNLNGQQQQTEKPKVTQGFGSMLGGLFESFMPKKTPANREATAAASNPLLSFFQPPSEPVATPAPGPYYWFDVNAFLGQDPNSGKMSGIRPKFGTRDYFLKVRKRRDSMERY